MALYSSEAIKPFTHEQALFIHQHMIDNPDQKISYLQRFFKKQFNLVKLPTIRQIRQCVKYAENAAMLMKKFKPDKSYTGVEINDMALFGYIDCKNEKQ